MNQHNLLQQIESNTLPILELNKEIEELFTDDSYKDLLHYDDITLLLQALSRNESIHCIRLDGDFLDCLHPLQRSLLLRTLANCLPDLRHIGLGDSPILVADLCHLVSKSKSLRSLHLHDSILQGSIDDVEAMEHILAGHPTIEEFEISECTSTIPGTNIKTLANARQRRSPTRVLHNRSSSLLNSKRFHIANTMTGKRNI
mmetsp:Transcript_14546/g.36547  ORF Transcript_14546/g.36547 Transcript_14546/m.36547 type:complete len:201 (+) Transcript_14546:607-1209(+)